MAITEQTRPYETLIRHNDDGSIAAHHQQISEVVKDGVVIAATVLSPVTLGTAEANGVNLADVIGQAVIEAVADAEATRSANLALETQVEFLTIQLIAAQEELALLKASASE